MLKTLKNTPIDDRVPSNWYLPVENVLSLKKTTIQLKKNNKVMFYKFIYKQKKPTKKKI